MNRRLPCVMLFVLGCGAPQERQPASLDDSKALRAELEKVRAERDELKQRPAAPPDPHTVITIVLKLKFKPEFEQTALAAAEDVIAKVRANEPGNLLLTLNKAAEPNTWVWVERYRDAAAFATHLKQPYMNGAIATIRSWVAAPPEFMKLEAYLPK